MNIGLHNCTGLHVKCHSPDNNNSVAIAVQFDDGIGAAGCYGEATFTLFGLPKEITDKLLSAFPARYVVPSKFEMVLEDA